MLYKSSLSKYIVNFKLQINLSWHFLDTLYLQSTQPSPTPKTSRSTHAAISNFDSFLCKGAEYYGY